MDAELVEHEKRQLVSQYGNWTAHNIQLVDDLYTIDNKIAGDEEKL